MSTKTVQQEPLELTPRQVAQALGLSESSLKRWCDRGAIPTRRTVGGHRRLPVAGVLRFVREKNFVVRNPSLLGLPAGVRSKPKIDDLRGQVVSSLVEGDFERVRQLGLEAFLASSELAPLFDEIIAPALHDIGRLWRAGELEVFRERRAIGAVRQLLDSLRRLVVLPEQAGPLALGATLEGDYYEVAVNMGELVLADVGWRTQTIGSNVPISTVLEAMRSESPSLLWLSLSHVVDEDAFTEEYGRLYEFAVERGIAVAVGGAALEGGLRPKLRATAFGSSMAELAELGRALRPRSMQ